MCPANSVQLLQRGSMYASPVLQAISVIVTHRTDDMSRLPSQIATTNAPAKQKPQEARLKLRLAPVPASKAANGPAEGTADGPCASGQGQEPDDVAMKEPDDVVAAADAAAAVQEGVGSPGDRKSPTGKAGWVSLLWCHATDALLQCTATSVALQVSINWYHKVLDQLML